MNSSVYRVLGWLVPLAIISAAAFAIYSQYGALKDAEARHSAAVTDLDKATKEKAMVDATPADKRYAAADQDTSEETKFLDDLRRKAHETGTSIVSWTSQAAAYGEGGAVPPDVKDADLLKGVTRISCDLMVDGPYSSIRKFVGLLNDSGRLFSVNNISWRRAENGTSLSLSLIRYVAPASGVSPTSSTTSNVSPPPLPRVTTQ